MTIAVIVAMQKEMESLTTLLTNHTSEQKAGFTYVVGSMGANRLVLHQSGMGKVNAAIGASELIRNYHPDYLVSSGCAGGLSAELHVMDVIASTSTVYHDVYVGEAGEGLEIMRPYPSSDYMVDKARLLSQQVAETIHLGQICTGDQFVTELDKLLDIKRRYPEALAVDMESCAIAHTCHTYGVPFISFRVISDTIGAEQHVAEYKNFWTEMANHSFHVVNSFLHSL